MNFPMLNLKAFLRYTKSGLTSLSVIGIMFFTSFHCLDAQPVPMVLDESCTVTVGNQTSPVRADGSFIVPNISIFQSRDTGIAPQLYRVRVVCLRNGQQTTGQSGFISLVPGQTVYVGNIYPSLLDPIPTSITATANKQVIAQGETAQLTVIASFSDGSPDEDVTLRSKGTTYLSTNTSIFTVNENGEVTNVNASSRIRNGSIAILNEGNLATITFQAGGPPNDLDSDGMPNDYEDLFGLNKNVNDANGDLDGDGLTNKEEMDLGTLPNNKDTDGDGIEDGVDGNPLVPEESPPTVTIVSPVDGSSFIEGTTVRFNVDATDDGLLTQVELTTDQGFSDILLAPPFQFDVVIPIGVNTLGVTATATDASNKSAADTIGLMVIDDMPPTVQIIDPANPNPVFEGQPLRVEADVSDDVGIVSVDLILNGQTITLNQPPFAADFFVPINPVGNLIIEVTATDTQNQQTTDRHFATILQDPGTVVKGRVLGPNNAPVLGATVEAFGTSGLSLADGSFTLPGVSTVRGDITVTAFLEQAGQAPLRGSSSPVTPVPNQIVNVGDILLRGEAVIGYYDMNLGQGNPSQIAPIVAAGHLPVNIFDLSLPELQSIDVLFVQNPSNGGFGNEFLNQLPILHGEILNGLSVIVHDRYVSNAESILPNGNTFNIIRNPGANIDILPPANVVTAGPLGVLDDTSLDGGNHSHHGYALGGTLPPDADLILSTQDPSQIVTFGYPVGQGFVTYSSIPLDHYLAGNGSGAFQANSTLIYAPNVIQYGVEHAGPRPGAGGNPPGGAPLIAAIRIEGDPNAWSANPIIIEKPEIISVEVQGPNVVIQFTSQETVSYRLEFNAIAIDETEGWQVLLNEVSGEAGSTTVTHETALHNGEECFYRVVSH